VPDSLIDWKSFWYNSQSYKQEIESLVQSPTANLWQKIHYPCLPTIQAFPLSVPCGLSALGGLSALFVGTGKVDLQTKLEMETSPCSMLLDRALPFSHFES
jgi:hypothetical protein